VNVHTVSWLEVKGGVVNEKERKRFQVVAYIFENRRPGRAMRQMVGATESCHAVWKGKEF